MLEGDKIVGIDGIGTPGPDGLVEIPVNPSTNTVPVTFTTPPSEITQVKVKPPTGTEPNDEVTVTVTFTDTDGTTVVKVC